MADRPVEHVAYLCQGKLQCCGEHGGWTVCCDAPQLHEPVALQTYCLHCLRKQWPPQVPPVSYGEIGCVWCGRSSQPLTTPAYRRALQQAQDRRRGFGGPAVDPDVGMRPLHTTSDPCPDTDPHPGPHEWIKGGALRRQCPGVPASGRGPGSSCG